MHIPGWAYVIGCGALFIFIASQIFNQDGGGSDGPSDWFQ